MIPGFQLVNGVPVLDPGARFTTDVGEVRERFVEQFPDSLTREDIYNGWRRRRRKIFDIYGENFEEWVSGSFVTGKVDPADLDCVIFFREGVWDGLPRSDQSELESLIVGTSVKIQYGCDSYVVMIPPDGAGRSRVDAYNVKRGYWDDLWSSDRVAGQKGYLAVRGAA